MITAVVAAGLGATIAPARAADPVGTITEYPIPTLSSNALGITAGPDGNMWFTESNVSKVAKITTSGLITEYPIPTPNSDPGGIAAGPDGNVWFVEHLSTGLNAGRWPR